MTLHLFRTLGGWIAPTVWPLSLLAAAAFVLVLVNVSMAMVDEASTVRQAASDAGCTIDSSTRLTGDRSEDVTYAVTCMSGGAVDSGRVVCVADGCVFTDGSQSAVAKSTDPLSDEKLVDALQGYDCDAKRAKRLHAPHEGIVEIQCVGGNIIWMRKIDGAWTIYPLG